MTPRVIATAVVCGAMLGTASSAAQAPAGGDEPTRAASPAQSRTAEVDRVVVRWWIRGRPEEPRVIFARELAFEARVEALAEGYAGAEPYADKHVRAAVQRHVTEAMLADLEEEALGSAATDTERSEHAARIGRYAEGARRILERRVGGVEGEGRARLAAAMAAEGVSQPELDELLRRQARASLYLDERVAPMLEPDDVELRDAHARGETPYTDAPFETVREEVKNWLVGGRLAVALDRYFRGARQRVHVELVRGAP